MSRLGFLRPHVDGSGEAPECELCGGPLETEHRHVVEVHARRILCACAPCALLFEGPSPRRFRAVPERVRREEPFFAVDAWEALAPFEVSFALFSSAEQRWIVVVPGPTGAVESELDPERWHEVWARSLLARSLESDVEALVVRTRPGRAAQAFAAPIDRCYALMGTLRHLWRGRDGGSEASAEVDAFFERLSRVSEPSGLHEGQGDRP